MLNAFRSLGPGRILALFIGIAAVIAISSLVVNRAQTPSLALLYGGLNAQEASRINDYLASQNIPSEVRGDGAVYVPSDRVGELRLQVAGQGLVGGSTTGYELFDNQSTFGTTNFVSNLNAKRALEGELARTIGTIPAVSGARVHIVLPKQNLFSREQVTPTAAIALNLGSRTLTPEQVQSIAQLAAAAVPNLTSANVTIIDQRGTLLYDGKSQNDTASSAGTMRRGIEKSYEDSISAMLERVVGAGNAVVRVTADLNLEKLSEQSELYDPTQQVVRSEQTIESTNTAADGTNGGVTGVAGNTPGGNGAGATGGSNSNEARTETTTNYEISKTVRSLTKQGGDVRKLSVAVLVAGKATPAAAPAEGEAAAGDAAAAPAAYTPLTDDEKARIRTLVETAIGYDEGRGDKVEIVDMPFTPAQEPAAIAEPFLTKAQMLNLGQYLLIVVALAIVALFVVKPALGTLNQALTSNSSNALLPGMAPGMGGAPMAGGAPPMPAGEDSAMIDIRSVQGRVRESAVKKVNEIIDQYPEESLGVVRNWMGGNSSSDSSS